MFSYGQHQAPFIVSTLRRFLISPQLILSKDSPPPTIVAKSYTHGHDLNKLKYTKPEDAFNKFKLF